MVFQEVEGRNAPASREGGKCPRFYEISMDFWGPSETMDF